MSEPQQPRQLTDLPESEQIKIIEGAAQDSNRMQRELVERAEPQQYTLRRPVTILNELRWSLELNMGDYAMPIDRDAFESEFVPVGSVDNLQQQIRQIIHERFQWCEHCNDQIDEPELGNVDDLTKMAVKEVLVLFGLENKETGR